MRILIDGYNVMFALGLLPKRPAPDGLRKVRERFLNDLAHRLGPVDAHQTTIVFDARSAPPGRESEIRHKGLTVVFAVGDENADARIERLIAQHSSPKSLTVASSDNRVRQAATRRKAKVLSADEFWSRLEAQEHRRAQSAPVAEAPARSDKLSPEETSFWLQEFAELAAEPDIQRELSSDPSLLTDAEILEIEREVARETESQSPRRKRRS